MKTKGRFSQFLEGVKNVLPARREQAYPEGETWDPEAYGTYPEGEYGAPGAFGDYPAEDYPPEEGAWEEYSPMDYPPEDYPPEDYPAEDYPPEDYAPEDYAPGYAPPADFSPEEEIPSLEEPEDYAPRGEEPSEEVPIEEFSLEELSEEEAPEELSAQPEPEPLPSPPENWEIPEPEEPLNEDPRRLPRLLSPKGRLRHPGWAETDLYEYNKERLRPAFRRKEWELYQLHNDRFALRICYGHAVYMSLVEVTLTDFASGERFTSGKRQFFPGDSLDLDFTGSQPHSLKYEDEELFLSISYDGEIRRIQLRSPELEAELSCHDTGDAVVTAVPFEARTQFAYNYKKIFQDLFGHVSLHNRELTLDGDTFLTLWSSRGVWPYGYGDIWCAGAQQTEEGILALNLGGGYGREDAPTENAVFVDGTMIKLGKVAFRFSSEDTRKPWRMVDRDRRLKLTFRPAFDEISARNWLVVSTRCHRLYGRLSGHIELPDGTERQIRDMPFFCQYGVYRW